ncbi:T6SS phospholipase effector Tle1-like catalytic domain-containing protein [Pseudoduganella namucuonensis]|uniref:Uncharacterized alpha/beta hydrolase domain n=1 Tax=Pseudoduganella namucuonensis TaxID=1035707 RepID=A0A1I7M0B9_9BURK|nr:DUF2235 domain-containing protein [Pseudoduganella namucuonensis]SFV15403.1 Uncharacterized alpha/beta hydrolase domain [Pseudoduganella namucuonensis]
MDEKIACSFEGAIQPHVKKITRVEPLQVCDTTKCEVVVQIGLFFDGTSNNLAMHLPSQSHTNVVRLFQSYSDKKNLGFFRIYMPGAGTPFPEIGEHSTSTKGSAFGSGCEARVLYGLLSIFNSLSKVVIGEALFPHKAVLLLCTADDISSVEDKVYLAKFKASTGLQEPKNFTRGRRSGFLRKQSAALAKRFQIQSKPVVKECLVDVFGFSRGAAEARVFCNWLDELLVDGKFAGIPLRVRFLGLFDTVASAGFGEALADGLTNNTNGHNGWAEAQFLRVPALVENCVHMVAMHELRKNFPLDEIGVNGVYPEKYQQFAYPGSHSDVGGGYAPGDLGIAAIGKLQEGDAMKLSQIPLNHMFEYAVAAGVPLDKNLVPKYNDGSDSFTIAPALLRSFNEFLRESGPKRRPLHEWMQVYLNWRWQIRMTHDRSQHMRRANKEDQVLLRDANRRLIKDAALLLSRGDTRQANEHVRSVLAGSRRNIYDKRFGQIAMEIPHFDDEAAKVLADARAAAPVSPAIASFFDNFVHDSFAGFCKDLVESTGYWRYRKAFKGTPKPTFASNEEGSTDKAA